MWFCVCMEGKECVFCVAMGMRKGRSVVVCVCVCEREGLCFLCGYGYVKGKECGFVCVCVEGKDCVFFCVAMGL